MNNKFRNSIYLYFSLLLFSCILIMLFFSNIVLNTVLEEELFPSNLDTLNSIVYNMDTMLGNVDSISLQIATDTNINYFLNKPFSDDYLKLSALNDSMEYITGANHYIFSSYIYYPHKEDILTVPNGKIDRAGFFDNKWLSSISFETNQHILYYSRTIAIDNKEKKLISYLRYFPVGSTYREAAVIINLDVDEISNILRSENNAESVILVLDKENNIIASTFDEKENEKEYFELISENRENKSSDWQEKNKNELVSFIAADNGWKYVMVTPIKALTEYKKAVSLLSIFWALFSLVVGLYLIKKFSKKLYNPIQTLASYLSDNESNSNKNQSMHFKYDEFKQIYYGITRIIEHNKKNMTYATERILWGLLCSNLNMNNDDISEIDLPVLEHNFYFVFVTEIDNYESLIKTFSDEQLNSIQNVIMNLTDKYVSMNQDFEVYGIRTYAYQAAYIVGFSDGDYQNTVLQTVFKAAESVKEQTKELLDIDITTGISLICEDVEKLGELYEQACEAVDYRMVEGPSNIIYYNNINFSQSLYIFPQKYEDLLITAIKTTNKEAAYEAINGFVESIGKIKGISNKQIFYMFAQLLGSITKMVYKMGGSITEIYGDLNIFDKFAECKFLNQIDEFFKKLCDGLIFYIKEKQNNKHETIVASTVNFIDNNYSESGISIELLAEKVYISSNYLERMFKEYRGQTILEYLNCVRMEKAKQLLKESSLKIDLIAEKVGYNSSRAFIRAFKKYEGVTPGVYRQNLIEL